MLAGRYGQRRKIAENAPFDPGSWSHAAVNRVIPNLVELRDRRMDLAVMGDREPSLNLLRQIGRMIGRPFEPPFPLVWLTPEGRPVAEGAPGLDTLFQRVSIGASTRPLLLFVVMSPRRLSSALPSRLEAALGGATGLAVLPEPDQSEQCQALTRWLLEAGWLPFWVGSLVGGRSGGWEQPMLDNERLARTIHELFLENAWTRGERHGTSPALQPWCRLDATYRRANCSQAMHLAFKLAASRLIVCARPLIADGSAEPLWSRTDFIEPLARMEHDRWASDRILDGWVYGEQRDNQLRRHPDLIPYDGLSEAAREKDRVAVSTVPFVLQLAGLGWRPLITVRLLGVGPESADRRMHRRWRRDLIRAAAERAPAMMEFVIDLEDPGHWRFAAECVRLGFPVSLQLSDGSSRRALRVDSDGPDLADGLALIRRISWRRDDVSSAASSVPLVAQMHRSGGLRVERCAAGVP